MRAHTIRTTPSAPAVTPARPTVSAAADLGCRCSYEFGDIPVQAASTNIAAGSPHAAEQPTEPQPPPPAQQVPACSLAVREQAVIDPTDQRTVPEPRPLGRHVLGITHLFIRGQEIKDVQQRLGNEALADLLFPRIHADASIGLEGKRCTVRRPPPVSTDSNTFTRISVLRPGPWQRTIMPGQLEETLGRVPMACDRARGPIRLVIGGHPSVDDLRGATRAEELEHAADQERTVCRYVAAYERAVSGLPSSFLTGLFDGCEEAAERRTGRTRMDWLRDFVGDIDASASRRHAAGGHTHHSVNTRISAGCAQIEFDLQ